MNTTIGKVSATERYPSTVDEFYFWTNKEQILSPFDVVKVKHMKDDEGKETTTFGVIEEMSHITDASSHMSSYISSDFGDTKEVVGNMNRLGMNYIKTRVIHNTKDIYTPVLDGQQVELCDKEDVKKALGLDRVQNPLVCGYLSMYRKPNQIKIPIEINGSCAKVRG